MNNPAQPILIIGAGLAGLHLAWSLYSRNQQFKIVTHDFGKPAWKASAGIINPVTGKRVVKSWKIDTLLPVAVDRYEQIATYLKKPSAYHSIQLTRYFRDDPDERVRFFERCADPDYSAYLKQTASREAESFEIAQSGWVDVQAFVEESRNFFAETGHILSAPQPVDAYRLSLDNDPLIWENQTWSHIVFCEGYQGQSNPYFNWLDYRISRGDVIDFSTHCELPNWILNREKWVLPLSRNHGRTGSTYSWERLESEPKIEEAMPLLDAWDDLLPTLPKATITQHRVGIRPGTNDSKPYAGPHPLEPRLCILNGFGSKGASQSPWCAERLADYLIQRVSLPKEIDPARRLKFLKTSLPNPREIVSSS